MIATLPERQKPLNFQTESPQRSELASGPGADIASAKDQLAGMGALAAGYICHYNFGLSRLAIRQDALVMAGVLAALVAIDCCIGIRQKQE